MYENENEKSKILEIEDENLSPLGEVYENENEKSNYSDSLTFNEYRKELRQKELDNLTLEEKLVLNYFRGRDSIYLAELKKRVACSRGVELEDRLSILQDLPLFKQEISWFKKVNFASLFLNNDAKFISSLIKIDYKSSKQSFYNRFLGFYELFLRFGAKEGIRMLKLS